MHVITVGLLSLEFSFLCLYYDYTHVAGVRLSSARTVHFEKGQVTDYQETSQAAKITDSDLTLMYKYDLYVLIKAFTYHFQLASMQYQTQNWWLKQKVTAQQ